jgi:N-acetylglucosamine-6-sulfatase/beta-glucosidase
LDFGQGGDQTQHVLWRLRNIDVRQYRPKIAVVMIGTNNFNDTPEDIAAGVKAVVATTQEVFPGIKIALVSILPSKRAFDKMNAVNALVRPICDDRSTFYLDLAARFVREGETWPALQKDQLHVTREGYEIWAEELNRLLARIE